MTTPTATEVVACCTLVYGHPLAELLMGDSFHPGGREATRSLLMEGRLAPGSRLLDVGCGLGVSARIGAEEFGLDVDAVDAAPAIIDAARDRSGGSRVRFAVAELPTLPFADASFDGVLAECVLSTVERAAALAEIRRVLRPMGRLLLSDVISRESLGEAEVPPAVLGALCIGTAWADGEMENRLGAAGFSVPSPTDRSTDLIALADRVEARAAVVGLVARDLGLSLADLAGTRAKGELAALADASTVRRITSAVRRAVDAGRLGYVSLVAGPSAGSAA